jgi:hypothetical protein
MQATFFWLCCWNLFWICYRLGSCGMMAKDSWSLAIGFRWGDIAAGIRLRDRDPTERGAMKITNRSRLGQRIQFLHETVAA